MPNAAAKKPSRRHFLLGALGVTGALVVGWGVLPPRQRLALSTPLPVKDGEIALNGWIRLARDGSVILAMPRSEMGQGVHTALPMLVAEELDLPLSAIRIEQAPNDRIFGNIAALVDGLPFHPEDQGVARRGISWVVSKLGRELGLNITGGSSSVKDAWEPMRLAAATARAMLVAAAAQEWKVSTAECSTAEGFITHASGKRASYAELAAAAAHMQPKDVQLKDPAKFRLIGQPQARRDSAAKTNGTARFGVDVRAGGQVYAAVRMAPVLGARIKSIDFASVNQMPGVIRVVDCSVAGAPAAVGVIAHGWWQAKQAVDAVKVEWEGGHTGLSSDAILKDLAEQLDAHHGAKALMNGFTYINRGDSEPSGAAQTIKAEYRAPFLAHATMEPMNCTAQLNQGKLNLWCGTQVPGISVAAAAKVAGVKEEDVVFDMTYLGGGFGRRLEIDFVVQAVAIAKQAGGMPVQLIWTREQDMAHDFYRPAAVARFSAALDKDGNPLALRALSASGSVTQQFLGRLLGLPGGGPDKTSAHGEFDQPYEFPGYRVETLLAHSEVPIGNWRSVGHSHNAFFTESFVDEIAHAGKLKPLELRRRLLKNHKRELAVLDAAVKAAGEPAPGRAHGLAFHSSFGTSVAQVAEVSIEGSTIRVHKVFCAIDCGLPVNPNIIAQQVESAVVYGLSAALYGEVRFEGGQAKASNFHDQPALRMNEAPEVTTIVMPSSAHPEGVGEPGLPPLAPAVANAVFTLTGKRLRSLPLKLS